MNSRKPAFIIIGAAKSGTTSLYEYLCRHPQIYMSTPKEPDFFSVDANYEQGMDSYYALFEPAQADQVCGEASTTYSRLHQHPQTVKRIHAALPQVKLIYIMRQPIDRAYSFYIHRFKGALYRPEQAVEDTFEATIKQQPEFIESSYYLEQIEQYLKLFSRQSCLFLLMKDLIEQPGATLEQILTFIGVDPQIDLVQQEQIIANKAGDYPEWYVKEQLLGSVKSIPGVQTLSELMPKQLKQGLYQLIKRQKYQDWQTNQFLPPPMLPETRTMLLDHFQAHNKRLAEFLGRDLSHWNQ
ncbi:MAG: sulfotransferase domain-containing protein [Cyanobacteria bacterium J06621_12]